jgi:hypothetical protein
MKNVRMNAKLRLVSFTLFLMASVAVSAQDGLTKRPNVAIGDNVNGFLQYLPVGYSSSSGTYPLMVYIHGANSHGNGSSAALDALWTGSGSPHEQQDPLDPSASPYWVDEYTVGAESFRFIIITPQFEQDMIAHIPTPDEINAVIDYAVANYRVDTSRIYLVGQSQGAGAVWDYAGSNSLYANRLAAIVPFSGVSFPFQEKSNIMKNAGVKVWAFHNLNDESVPSSFTIDYVNFYNNPPAPAIPAKATIFNSTGHLSWFLPLTRQYSENGMNVYEWMLQYETTPTTAYAGNDQEIALPANSVQLNGTGFLAGQTITGYSWTQVSGPSTVAPSNPSISNPTLSNLVRGTYIYRLTVTYSNGSTASDNVTITVNPSSTRYEAENYSAASGPVRPNPFTPGSFDMVNDPSVEDATTRIDLINQTDWLEYNVTVPVAGTYRLRFRAGTGPGGTRFEIRNSSGTPLDTVVMFSTGYNDYMNLFAQIPLTAGSQTIRILSNSTAFPANSWFLNWFEIIDEPVAMAVLPVNFVLFNADCDNGRMKLLWKTSSEINSRDYTVEKSTNGRTWTTLATLPSSNNPTIDQTYTYTDLNGSNSFYRVVETGFDGRKTYTSVIRGNCAEKAVFNLYPNPVIDQAVLSIGLEKQTRLRISIVDSKGSLVQQRDVTLPKGTSQFGVNLEGFAGGTYTLLAQWEDQSRSIQLIKK